MNETAYGYLLRASAAAGNSMSYDECRELNAFMTKKTTTRRNVTVSCDA